MRIRPFAGIFLQMKLAKTLIFNVFRLLSITITLTLVLIVGKKSNFYLSKEAETTHALNTAFRLPWVCTNRRFSLIQSDFTGDCLEAVILKSIN